MSYNPPPPPPPNHSSWNTPSSPPHHADGNASHHHHHHHHMPALSRDEIRALKECNTESFYYRCVPLSTLFSGLAYIGIKNGYFKKSPRFGYAPKMFVGAVIGYIGGKLSYQKVCEEKVMRLPNSNLAATLRKRRGIQNFEESVSTESGFSHDSSLNFQRDKLTVDERRPDLSEHEEGIDSYNTVKENLSPYTENDEAWKQQKFTSYDELRRENREEYFSKISDKYKRPVPDRSSPPSSFPGDYNSNLDKRSVDNSGSRLESGPDTRREPYFNPKKNKYGDLWDD